MTDAHTNNTVVVLDEYLLVASDGRFVTYATGTSVSDFGGGRELELSSTLPPATSALYLSLLPELSSESPQVKWTPFDPRSQELYLRCTIGGQATYDGDKKVYLSLSYTNQYLCAYQESPGTNDKDYSVQLRDENNANVRFGYGGLVPGDGFRLAFAEYVSSSPDKYVVCENADKQVLQALDPSKNVPLTFHVLPAVWYRCNGVTCETVDNRSVGTLTFDRGTGACTDGGGSALLWTCDPTADCPASPRYYCCDNACQPVSADKKSGVCFTDQSQCPSQCPSPPKYCCGDCDTNNPNGGDECYDSPTMCKDKCPKEFYCCSNCDSKQLKDDGTGCYSSAELCKKPESCNSSTGYWCCDDLCASNQQTGKDGCATSQSACKSSCEAWTNAGDNCCDKTATLDSSTGEFYTTEAGCVAANPSCTSKPASTDVAVWVAVGVAFAIAAALVLVVLFRRRG